MLEKVNRRSFLKKTAIATGAGIGLSIGEKALSAKATEKPNVTVPKDSIKGLPAGKIGNVKISRLICGGNLIGGEAHSRDLGYVGDLMLHYFTDERIIETLQLCEELGINSILADNSERSLKIINKFRKERGGKIKWIAEGNPEANDVKTNLQMCIDNGADAIYIQGGIGDRWVKLGRVELLAKSVEFIKKNGLPAGIGGHSVEVPIACEKAAIECDFYMKTLHSGNYWSATDVQERREFNVDSRFEGSQYDHDNIWSITPEKTIEFMRQVDKSWIAYKVLAAGAIHPRDGFKYAFENGADFICVGMFDFQIVEDVIITKKILSEKMNRKRPWMG